jgi:hypothetical protein
MEFCPLHNSVINGHFEAVRYLVENGADIQASGVVRLFIVPPLNVSRTIMRPYFLLGCGSSADLCCQPRIL